MYYIWFMEGKNLSLEEIGKQIAKLIVSGTEAL
jgi:hypothetical protein